MPRKARIYASGALHHGNQRDALQNISFKLYISESYYLRGVPQITQLSDSDAKMLGLSKDMKLRWCYPQHDVFLEFHRQNVFKNDE